MSLATAEAPAAILNSKHRCDRCGSRAYVVTVLRRSEQLPKGGELLWCAHHFRQVADEIIPYVAALIDETSQLTKHVADDHHVN
jgi:hypothetical protein